MRLIYTVKDPNEARQISSFLQKKNIENELEQGADGVRIWIISEDDFPVAAEWLRNYQENPEDRDLQGAKNIPIIASATEEDMDEPLANDPNQPQAYVTLSFIFICVILFAASFLTNPVREYVSLPYPQVAIYSSEVTQTLLFDFPKAYEILESIVTTYGISGLKDPSTMPAAGQALLQEYTVTPWWQGYYQEIVHAFKGVHPPSEVNAPMFEKIRQGEVWRLFTPAVLHLDVFHLLFNMLWLFVLGKQMELRIGAFRFLIFCFSVGIFANIVQYLVSGPNFIGFSGILCGFFTFIWVRQQKAPWEGYRLDRSTIIMIGIFIGGLFLIQVASFVAEVYANTSIAPMIANAAHISGGIAGLILGRTKFFAWNNN